MKKLIINIGQEAIVGASYEISGKTKTIERLFEFPSLNYYNNLGMLDIVSIVATIKKMLPKKSRHLDIDLILPTHITDVAYIDAINNSSTDTGEEKTRPNIAVKSVYIGENQTKKINQQITYNSKALNNIILAFYKEHLNVVRAVSNVTCYHNFISLFNGLNDFTVADSKTHICVVWGASKISYVIMQGNLPVEVRTSDLRLTDIYKDISTMGGDIPFYQILKIMNTFNLSQDASEGILLETTTNQIYDGDVEITLPDSIIDLVKDRFFSFLTDMVREVRAVFDYVSNKYNATNVMVCTNSLLLDECLCKTLSDNFPIEYPIVEDTIAVYNDSFNIKSFPEFNDKYNPIFGCVIETIKKGGDFYDA